MQKYLSYFLLISHKHHNVYYIDIILTCRITYFYSTVVPDSNIGIAIIKLLTMSIAHRSVTDMQPVMFTASLCFTLHNTIERAIYGTTLSDAFINMLGRVVLSHSCHTFFVLHPRMSLLTCLLRRCSLYYRATAVVTITLSLPINS